MSESIFVGPGALAEGISGCSGVTWRDVLTVEYDS